jgi:hypothetical protein
MRHLYLSLVLLVVCIVPSPAQTPSASAFQQQAQTALFAGRTYSALTLTATAEWTAGSLHQSGTAQLQAKADGSNNFQLDVGSASRTEMQTKSDASRTCAWTDAAGTSHNIVGPNCMVALPWFAPSLFSQSLAVLPSLLGTTDDGPVSKDGATLHQISYLLNLQGMNSAFTSQMVSQSTMKVFYDPQTFLPASLEYFIHPDGNNLQNIPVRVVFSNYQPISGVMLPFSIERYVNRSLQLTLNVTNATIQ